ncbi:MAG: hypothetical protein DRJ08_03150 [Acidobacteria bacterium]|nr:MAG: hypothetical protein DRJ08_03150 [Acidobacteriota bacterium]
MKAFLACMLLTTAMYSVSCIKMEHEVTIKPVHITVEVRVKIDKELDDFFGDLDATTAPKK